MVKVSFPVSGFVRTILHTNTVCTFFPTLSMLLSNLSTADVVLSRNTTGSLNPSPLIAYLLVFLLIASETRVGLIFLPDFLFFLSLFSSFLLISPNFFFPLHFTLANILLISVVEWIMLLMFARQMKICMLLLFSIIPLHSIFHHYLNIFGPN